MDPGPKVWKEIDAQLKLSLSRREVWVFSVEIILALRVFLNALDQCCSFVSIRTLCSVLKSFS